MDPANPPTTTTPPPDDPAPRKANAAVVDQVQGHEKRLENLEKGFFSKLFGEQTKPPPAPPTGQTQPAPKKKPVIEELGEVADPFGVFEDEKPAPAKPEAPAADDAA